MGRRFGRQPFRCSRRCTGGLTRRGRGHRAWCGDDACLVVHRPAWLGPIGRGAGVRGRLAVHRRHEWWWRDRAWLRCLLGLPHGARGHPRRRRNRCAARVIPWCARGSRPRQSSCTRAVRWALAGHRDRGRRPADRGRRERAAEGDRGAGTAHGLAAVRTVSRRPRRDDSLAMPRGCATYAADRCGRFGACLARRCSSCDGGVCGAGRARARRPRATACDR